MPDVDAPASTEVGVIMMGLEADRLLAGLGFAALADDPTTVTLIVDQARHGALRDLTSDALVALGCDRWLALCPALDAVARPASAALRQLWAQALQAVEVAETGPLSPASRAYLAACWLRRYEVDKYVEAQRAVPAVAPR
jgi:hypothetical protein